MLADVLTLIGAGLVGYGAGAATVLTMIRYRAGGHRDE